jgi:hypothetical protein
MSGESRPDLIVSRRAARPQFGGDRELDELMDDLAAIAVRNAREPQDTLEAELWASSMIGSWRLRALPRGDTHEIFFASLVRALEKLGSVDALATLLALSLVAPGIHGKRCRAAARRLAGTGVPQPRWSADIGPAVPTSAALMYDASFDDGVTVLIEFWARGSGPQTLGIYVDHNLGGVVKDAFLAGPLSHARASISRGPVGLRELDLDEARTRVEAALETLDQTYDAPVDDDVWMLRALIDARMRLLPGGFELGSDYAEVLQEEREALLAAVEPRATATPWSSHASS